MKKGVWLSGVIIILLLFGSVLADNGEKESRLTDSVNNFFSFKWMYNMVAGVGYVIEGAGYGECTDMEQCWDNDPCTTDDCIGKVCVNDFIPNCGVLPPPECPVLSAPVCELGEKLEPYVGDDGCEYERCVPDSSNCPGGCDDRDECTKDYCNSEIVCVNKKIEGCRDSCPPIGCNSDRDCKLGGGNCAIGKCIFQRGGMSYCEFTPDDSFCDDRDKCNGNEFCSIDLCNNNAQCLPGESLSCDDGNVCSIDSCDSEDGCVQEPKNCDDRIGCTIDSCDFSNGCSNKPDNSLCEQGFKCDPFEGCIKTSCSSCEDCDGIFTSCSFKKCRGECYQVGGCYYKGNVFFSEDCVPLGQACLEISECEGYSKEECLGDPCNIGSCELNGNKCVSSIVVSSFCGDGVCNGNENYQTCSLDCKLPEPVCGDEKCEAGENCFSCETDCGECGPFCGDSICQAEETCGNCNVDCGCKVDEECNENNCVSIVKVGFSPDTLVMMSDNSYRKISEIKVGDKVMAYYDFEGDEKGPVEVEKVFSMIQGDSYTIKLEGLDATNTLTKGNYIYTTLGWKIVGEENEGNVLMVGDKIFLDDGTSKEIVEINFLGTTSNNYHLKNKDYNNFIFKFNPGASAGGQGFKSCCGDEQCLDSSYGGCSVCGGATTGCTKAPAGTRCGSTSGGLNGGFGTTQWGVCVDIDPNLCEYTNTGVFLKKFSTENPTSSYCKLDNKIYGRGSIPNFAIKTVGRKISGDVEDTSQQGNQGQDCAIGTSGCSAVNICEPGCYWDWYLDGIDKFDEPYDCSKDYGENNCGYGCAQDVDGNPTNKCAGMAELNWMAGCGMGWPSFNDKYDASCNLKHRNLCTKGVCVKELGCLDCTTNTDCSTKYGSNFACVENECIKPCTEDGFCAQGETCDIAEGEGFGRCVAKTCRTLEECGEGQSCGHQYGFYNKCLGITCKEDNECLSGTIFSQSRTQNGFCKKKNENYNTGNCVQWAGLKDSCTECSADGSSCTKNKGCITCKSQCEGDTDCGDFNYKCINGVCIDDCNSEDNCMITDNSGNCVSSCSEDERCNSGVCVPKCQPKCGYYNPQDSNADADGCVSKCESNQFCIMGACVDEVRGTFEEKFYKGKTGPISTKVSYCGGADYSVKSFTAEKPEYCLPNIKYSCDGDLMIVTKSFSGGGCTRPEQVTKLDCKNPEEVEGGGPCSTCVEEQETLFNFIPTTRTIVKCGVDESMINNPCLCPNKEKYCSGPNCPESGCIPNMIPCSCNSKGICAVERDYSCFFKTDEVTECQESIPSLLVTKGFDNERIDEIEKLENDEERHFEAIVNDMRELINNPEISLESKNRLKLDIAKLYQVAAYEKSKSEIRSRMEYFYVGSKSNIFTGPKITELILKSELDYEGREIVKVWSPDGERYLSLNQKTVPDDYPTTNLRGKGIGTLSNLDIFMNELRNSKGSLEVLKKWMDRSYLPIKDKNGNNVKPFTENSPYLYVTSYYNNAIKEIKEVQESLDLTQYNDRRYNELLSYYIADLKIKMGSLKSAEDELKKILVNNPTSREIKSDIHQSLAELLIIKSTYANEKTPTISRALFEINEALIANPNNEIAKKMQRDIKDDIIEEILERVSGMSEIEFEKVMNNIGSWGVGCLFPEHENEALVYELNLVNNKEVSKVLKGLWTLRLIYSGTPTSKPKDLNKFFEGRDREKQKGIIANVKGYSYEYFEEEFFDVGYYYTPGFEEYNEIRASLCAVDKAICVPDILLMVSDGDLSKARSLATEYNCKNLDKLRDYFKFRSGEGYEYDSITDHWQYQVLKHVNFANAAMLVGSLGAPAIASKATVGFGNLFSEGNLLRSWLTFAAEYPLARGASSVAMVRSFDLEVRGGGRSVINALIGGVRWVGRGGINLGRGAAEFSIIEEVTSEIVAFSTGDEGLGRDIGYLTALGGLTLKSFHVEPARLDKVIIKNGKKMVGVKFENENTLRAFVTDLQAKKAQGYAGLDTVTSEFFKYNGITYYPYVNVPSYFTADTLSIVSTELNEAAEKMRLEKLGEAAKGNAQKSRANCIVNRDKPCLNPTECDLKLCGGLASETNDIVCSIPKSSKPKIVASFFPDDDVIYVADLDQVVILFDRVSEKNIRQVFSNDLGGGRFKAKAVLYWNKQGQKIVAFSTENRIIHHKDIGAKLLSLDEVGITEYTLFANIPGSGKSLPYLKKQLAFELEMMVDSNGKIIEISKIEVAGSQLNQQLMKGVQFAESDLKSGINELLSRLPRRYTGKFNNWENNPELRKLLMPEKLIKKWSPPPGELRIYHGSMNPDQAIQLRTWGPDQNPNRIYYLTPDEKTACSYAGSRGDILEYVIPEKDVQRVFEKILGDLQTSLSDRGEMRQWAVPGTIAQNLHKYLRVDQRIKIYFYFPLLKDNLLLPSLNIK